MNSKFGTKGAVFPSVLQPKLPCGVPRLPPCPAPTSPREGQAAPRACVPDGSAEWRPRLPPEGCSQSHGPRRFLDARLSPPPARWGAPCRSGLARAPVWPRRRAPMPGGDVTAAPPLGTCKSQGT